MPGTCLLFQGACPPYNKGLGTVQRLTEFSLRHFHYDPLELLTVTSLARKIGFRRALELYFHRLKIPLPDKESFIKAAPGNRFCQSAHFISNK